MRKRLLPINQDTPSSSNALADHLDRVGQVIDQQSQLKKNTYKIASPYILFLSCTVVPALTYAIMRTYFQFELPVALSQEVLQEAMEEDYFGHEQYDLLSRQVEYDYQDIIDFFQTAIPATFAALVPLDPLSEVGIFSDRLLSRHLEGDNFLLGLGEMIDAIQTKFNFVLRSIDGKKISGTFHGDLHRRNYNLASALAETICNTYNLLIPHIQNFMALIPQQINAELRGDLPYLDLQSRTLGFAGGRQLPKFSELATLLVSMRDGVKRMELSGKGKIVKWSTTVAGKLEHSRNLVINYYSTLSTVGFAAAAHRGLVTPLFRSIFPLRYWTSHAALSANRMDALSTQDLGQLVEELKLATADTRSTAERNDLITHLAYGLIGCVVIANLFDYDSLVALSFVIFYIVGLILEKVAEYGLAIVRSRQLDSSFGQRAEDLKTLFPPLKITCYKKDTLPESRMLLTVTKSVAPFSKLEYTSLILFTLYKFNVSVLAVSGREGEILISASQKIPVEAMQKFLTALCGEVSQIKEVERSARDNLGKLDLERSCNVNVVYDDNGFPSVQLLVTDPKEATQQFLLSYGFIKASEKHFILEIRTALPADFLTKFKTALLADKAKAIPQTKSKDSNAETTLLPAVIKRPKASLFRIHPEPSRSSSAAVYTWHNVCGEGNISSRDPRVRLLENGDFPMYLFFRLNEENLSEDTYKQLYEKSARLAGANKDRQGIKFYSEAVLPGDAIARVKMLGEQADTTVYVYRHERERNQPLLLYTDSEPVFSCHNKM